MSFNSHEPVYVTGSEIPLHTVCSGQEVPFMFPHLLFLLIVMPLVELWLLLRVGAHIGAGNTFLLVIITGVIGASLARQQGLKAWHDAQKQSAQGQIPGAALADGVMILIAGCLLMTPGIISDVIGFLLLVPPFRSIVRKSLRNRIRVQTISPQGFGMPSGQSESSGPWPNPRGSAPPDAASSIGHPDVIDVDHQRHES